MFMLVKGLVQPISQALCLIVLCGAATFAATFTVTNTNDSGPGSLRQAVLDSNTAATSDNIVFDASFNVSRTITLLSVITINPTNGDTLTITGPGANLLTISGNNLVGIFSVSTGDTASFSGMTLTQGNVAAGSGAAIGSFGSVTISNVTFTANIDAAVDLNNSSGNSSFTNCIFSQNLSTGIVIDSGSASVTSSVFSQNSGSAISNGGTLTVTVSDFSSNTGTEGGAISNGGTLTVSDSTFTGNTATSSSATGLGGGAIYSSSSATPLSTSITNSTFTNNSEIGGSGGGGALRNRSGTMNVSNSTFTGNSAVRGGGAVQGGGVTTITDSTITGNRATGVNASVSGQGSGGAISAQGASQTTISDCKIIGNEAVNSGGGIYYQTNTAGAFMNVTRTTISNNAANTDPNTSGGDGGGFAITGPGVVTVLDSTISGNTVAGNGGGFIVEGALTIDNSTVSENFASLNYGGIVDTNPGGTSDQVHISNCTIVNNRTNGVSGGFGIDSVSDAGQQSVRNTIIANNIASAGEPDIRTRSQLNSQGYNLIRIITGANIGGVTTGNIYGQDPMIAPLSFNGGATRTHALMSGSPAIDASDPTTFPAVDQRNIARPQDGDGTGGPRADIGAYERRISDTLGHGFIDIDGDQKTDLSIFRPNGAASEWWWLKSSGGNAAVVFGANTDTIVPADYTGDGKTDIAFWRPSNGNWFVLRSEDFSFFAFPFGANGDVPVPADYDGDGKADSAVFRASAVTWFINKSTGGTDIIPFGSAGDKPVPGDFDGDGKGDLAVFRPNGGTGTEWWVRRSSNASVFALQFGTPTDKAVPGDYTGDGKTDIAFWRPSNGNWFVLRSEDFSFFAFPFGANGDTAVPGDYDGDGRWDAGVFRPSNNTWFVQRTTAGTLIQTFGITGDLPLPNAYVR